MSDCSFFALNELNASLSLAHQLEQVSHSGSPHVVGKTVVLRGLDWEKISLNSSDMGEKLGQDHLLGGDHQIGGIRLQDRCPVKAEYSLALTDGNTTYSVFGFSVDVNTPEHPTAHGKIFAGSDSSNVPLNTPLKVVAAQQECHFPIAEYAAPVCFAEGTIIDTVAGPRAIETLQVGDLIHTRDDGLQPVRWIESNTMSARGQFAPIVISEGVLGNHCDLVVSPQHKLLLSGARTELMSGFPEALSPAVHLLSHPGVRRREGGSITYLYILLERHALILANGAWAESHDLGTMTLSATGSDTQRDLLTFSPELGDQPPYFSYLPVLSRCEAQLSLHP